MPDPEFGWGHDARRNSPSRKLNKDGTVRSVEPFITGFLQNNSYIGRPVDLHVMKDGSVLFSDDWMARSIASPTAAARSPTADCMKHRGRFRCPPMSLDYVVVFDERHLCHSSKSYRRYYKEARLRRFRTVFRLLAASL